MILPGRFRMLFKSISALVAGIFLFLQIGSVNIFADTQAAFVNLTDKKAVIGTELKFTVEASGLSAPENGLIYSASSLPPGAVFDAAARTFSWTPAVADKGTHEVVFEVSDGVNVFSQAIHISTIYIEEEKLTTGACAIYAPSIHDNIVTWLDYRNNNYDIYAYDMNTHTEHPVCVDAGAQLGPSVYDGKIVWEDLGAGSGNHDIYMRDLTSERAVKISGDPKDEYHPAIDGGRIVYSQYQGGNNYHLYLYDIASTQTTKITETPVSAYDPVIYKDNIVWGGNGDICIYDIPSASTRRITDNSAQHHGLRMCGDKLFWADSRLYEDIYVYDIYMHDLAKNETSLVTEGMNNTGFAVYGEKVIWWEWADQGVLYLFDIAAREKIQLKEDIGSDLLAMHENRVVWTARHRSNSDIYLLTLNFAPVIASCDVKKVPQGFLLNITGKDFGYTMGSGYVRLEGGVRAVVKTWADSAITCVIPDCDVNVDGAVNEADEAAVRGNKTGFSPADPSNRYDLNIDRRVNATDELIARANIGAGLPEKGMLKVITSGGPSNAFEVILPPLVKDPSNLTAAAVSPTKIDLGWQDNSGNERGFEIEMAADGEQSFSAIGACGEGVTSFGARGLASGKTYQFRVRAVAPNNVSGYSNIAAASTPHLAKPVVNAYSSPTSEPAQTFSGTKDVDTSIWMDGVEKVPLDDLAAWSASILITEGRNQINVTAKDSAGGQSEPAIIDIFLDTTPPAMPLVTDAGATTIVPDTLQANWSAGDPETGVGEYMYAIGTSAGGADVTGWTPCGTDTRVTRSGLNLAPGSTYYFSVKARNNVGLWSGVGSSDGIALVQTAPSITAVTPSAGSVFETGTVPFNISAIDPEQDAIRYKIVINGQVVSDWTGEASFNWAATSEAPGAKQATVYVKDVWGNESSINTELFLARKALDKPQ